MYDLLLTVLKEHHSVVGKKKLYRYRLLSVSHLYRYCQPMGKTVFFLVCLWHLHL